MRGKRSLSVQHHVGGRQHARHQAEQSGRSKDSVVRYLGEIENDLVAMRVAPPSVWIDIIIIAECDAFFQRELHKKVKTDKK